MYYILNKDEKIIGVLNNDGKSCPFYDDHHENAIAESSSSDNGKLAKIWSETLSLSVPYGYDETDLLERGTQILFKDSNDLYKLFTIYEVTDEINGETHRKSIDAFNSCIWKMSHTQIDSKKWVSANSKSVFSYIFERSGWTLDGFNEFYSGGVKSYELQEGTAQAALDEALKEFDVEVVAYAVINDGNIIAKHVQLVDRLGEDTGERFEYRHNIKGASRKETETEFYTKLYVKGGNHGNGKQATITSVNKVKNPKTSLYEYLPYLLDDEANDNYNAGKDYLEGVITNTSIINEGGLLSWGKEQLKYYNHPKFEYTVDVALLAERPQIGDKIVVVDFEMSPVMTVTARVVATNYSLSDVVSDSVTLGEFTTINAITPSLIWQMQANANQALQDAQNRDYRVTITSTSGNDFANDKETKTLVAQVFKGNKMVTPTFKSESFDWIRYTPDGLLDVEFNNAHAGVGNMINISFADANYIYKCNVDTDLTNAFFTESDFFFFSKLQTPVGGTDVNRRVVQYCVYDNINKNIFWVQGYSGSQVSKDDIAKAESFSITRTDNAGVIKDRMVCRFGGHGSHLGIEMINGVVWIYSAYRDVTAAKWRYVKFKYQAGKLLNYADTTLLNTEIATTMGRLNIDPKNGYYLTVTGSNKNALYRVHKRAIFEAKKYQPIHEFKAANFGINSTQTYQSSYLDYPYLYTTFGSGEGNPVDGDMPELHVVDVRTGQAVHEIDFNFTQGTINPTEELFHEIEGVTMYYDNDVKYLLVSFVFLNDNSELSNKTNHLYRVKLENL